MIVAAGGIVNDIFVEKVGVMMTKKSMVTERAKDLFNLLNIDGSLSEAEQHSEFNSRLTYLSFKENKVSAKDYNDKMINEFGHRSVYNDEHITFLVAGCSIETVLEFVAQREGTVSRLTSSKTKAQNETLYRLRVEGFSEDFIDLQKSVVKDFLSKIKNEYKKWSSAEEEVLNILNLGNKAGSFTISMSVKDWHKVFIGRFSYNGVESEMLEIITEIHAILYNEYPQFFCTKTDYFEMNNAKKY